jgi:hypothetical protein
VRPPNSSIIMPMFLGQVDVAEDGAQAIKATARVVYDAVRS